MARSHIGAFSGREYKPIPASCGADALAIECWHSLMKQDASERCPVGWIMNFYDFPRALRTIRHLRWSQIAARLGRTSRRRLAMIAPIRIRPDRVVIPECVPKDEFPLVASLSHAELDAESLIELLCDGKFRHLHQTEVIGRESPDWRLGVQGRSRLWTITLHYHRWAYQLAQIVHGQCAQAAVAENLLEEYLSDWISRCDLSVAGAEDLAWNSYAIATRLPVWIRLYFLLQEDFFSARPEFRTRFLSCLYGQAQHLAANVEWDLRANHLLRDAVGLAWAGRFFRGQEPRNWLQTATRLAREQVREQVLSDGGHFERSALYHLEAMHDFLALASLAQDDEINEQLRSACKLMADYAIWVRHPDGCSAQFNDSTRVPSAAIIGLGKSMGLTLDDKYTRGGRHFADTGMVAWHGPRWTLFFDVGNVGPRDQPAHAHADTLTVECSVDGHRLFVDPGSHSYDHDERRDYDRSTAAHNTVCVDGTDSSEVWHIFRVGRRASPHDVHVEVSESGLKASASHDGYAFLAGIPIHSRTVIIGDGEGIEIIDVLTGNGSHRVDGGYLLSPEWLAEIVPGGWLLRSGAIRLRVCLECDREMTHSIQRRWVHREYGLEEESDRLSWSYEGKLPLRVTTRVEILEPGWVVEEIECKEELHAHSISEP